MKFKTTAFFFLFFNFFCKAPLKEQPRECNVQNFPHFSKDVCLDLDQNRQCTLGDILLKKDLTYTYFMKDGQKETGSWQVSSENKILLTREGSCARFSFCNNPCNGLSTPSYVLFLEQGQVFYKNQESQKEIYCLESW